MSRLTRWFGLFLILAIWTGCASGPEVSRHLQWLQKRLEEAEKDGAKRCAPYAYAHGKAEYDFSKLELHQGQHVLADQHMRKARVWIKQTHEELDVWRQRKELWRCRGLEKSPEPPPKPDPCAKDTDNDGVADCRDLCPNQPEDFQGFEDDDGCPDGERDSDGDGIPDWRDKCPFEPEDFNGFQDDDGCPDAHIDTDGDGVPDYRDKCPLEYAKTPDGCPPKYVHVEVTKKQIRLKRQVHFATARAQIRITSFPMLREVAQVLNDHPHIHICIEGHTDDRGGYTYNLRLSSNRAAAIRTFLIRERISADRMRSRGYSFKFPIETNRTIEGRATNRRVELTIVEQGKPCPLDVETTKQKPTKKRQRR